MSLPHTRSAHTRRDTILLALLIIGLLIVFRDVPVVHAFLNFASALLNLLMAIVGLLGRTLSGSPG